MIKISGGKNTEKETKLPINKKELPNLAAHT
ncbi:hypothetical protein J2780_003040 [Chryseobacterium camelliae]|nr:hypothetical protein [Chryseobacterium camelliae]